MPTHYDRLGITPDADRDTVWRAYLSAVRQALSSDGDARTELAALDAAWDTLRYPETRATYDASIGVEPGREASDDEPRREIMDLLASLAETGHLPGDEDQDDEALASTSETDLDGLRSDEPPDQSPGDLTAAAQPDDAEGHGEHDHGEHDGEHDDEEYDDEEYDEDDDEEEPEDEEDEEDPGAARHTRPSRAERRRARRGARRRKRRRTWDGPSRPQGRMRSMLGVILWLVACAGVGAGAGWIVHASLTPTVALAEGSCVTLTPSEAFAVGCDSDDADARVVTATDSAEDCEDAEMGWIELPGSRYGCLTPVEAPAP